MSKVIKAIGKVAGIVAVGALALTGVGAIGAFGLAGVALGAIGSAILPIAGAIAMGASLLAGRPKAPSVPADTTDRLQSTIDPRTNRKFIFGNTAMATDIRDYEYTDDQTYCHQFIVVAAHKVAGIDQIWFNDKLAWTSSGGAQGDYAGYLTVTPILEGSAGNAINISPRMGSTRRYTGCAYVHVRYKLTGNSKKVDSPFAQAIPSKMVIRGRGAYVYDPRLDSTVPGGSGSQRANDQTTWAWDDNASRNPALQLLWYLLGWRINGKLSVGCGLGAKRIDLESFITAANLCDESVALAAGGTEPRYRGDGIGSTGVGPLQMIDNIKAAMNADLDDVDGKLRLTVFHNDLADPVADFGDDDMVDGFNWNQTPDLSDMFNVVRGTFVDSSDASLYQMIDYPEVSLPSRDEIERIDSFDLAFVQSPSQAQRLAKQRLQRQQYGGTLETVFNARGWLIEKNAVVRLSCSVLGWTNKLFRVAQMEHRVDGTCPVVLREENAAIYAWDKDEKAAVQPADPAEYDYTLNPYYQDMPTTAQLSRLDPLTGRGTASFQSTSGRNYTEFVAIGEARDGDTVTFPAPLPTVPRIIFTVGGLAATPGNNVLISAESISVSGFVMKAVEQAVTAGTEIVDSGAVAGGSGQPDFVMDKSSADTPFDGRYRFKLSVNVVDYAPGESGEVGVGIFVRRAGAWVQVGTASFNSSGSYTIPVSADPVDFGSGSEFGVSSIGYASPGSSVSGFTSVSYTPGTVSESSLTPPDASPIQWAAILG